MSTGEQFFVVTTRSRLRGARFFPSMAIATWRVRRQLTRCPEVVRWASVVAGPTEFWTVTVWRSRHDMQEFMRSGAHQDIMWLFSRWLSAFWQMRWRPGALEVGTWAGLAMGRPEDEDPDGDSPATAANPALQQALEHLPWLKAATGADGAASYESSPYARKRRAQMGGAAAVCIALQGPAWQTPAMLGAARRLERQAKSHDGCLRAVVGLGRPGNVYLLALSKDRAGAVSLLESPELAAAVTRWNGWANEWLAENEFGHWDGLRVRQGARRRHAIPVPAEAMKAAGVDADDQPGQGRR